MIDDNDDEENGSGDGRDTMLVERDSAILNTIRKTMSSKHESMNYGYSEEAVGTPLYLSPEIWTSRQYSKAADVWAIGVILHEILTLKHPFPAQTKDELKRKVCTE